MKKGKEVLSGLSIAGLIMAGSLPLMADEKAAKSCKGEPGDKVSMNKGDKQKVKEASASKTNAKGKNTAKNVEKSNTAK
jgi:hypothetical protein